MLLTFCLCLLALLPFSTPLTTLKTINTTSPLIQPSNNDFNCVPTWSLRPNTVNTRVCGGAIVLLPSSHAVGDFHYGPPPDRYELPIIKQYSYCRVVVELMSGFASEESSWLGVGVAASNLNIACGKTSQEMGYKNGWTNAGEHDGIRITLEWAKPLPPGLLGGGSNGTTVGAVA
ncbi:hypothetical protein MMC28_011673 [Mycoblastus sanguinarius]|nr:hypothetical protein [Mycoblastus sanguinarius]